MTGFVVRRLGWSLLTMLGVSLITFVLMHAVPGGPWDEEKALAPGVVENLNRRYGLDLPYWQQYLLFLRGAVQGDLGVSFVRQGQPVTQILLAGLAPTLTIAAAALTIGLVAGLTLGVGGAFRRNSWIDYLSTAVATAGATTPNFVLGVGFVLLFAVTLKIAPTAGWGGPQHLLLPALTLAALPTAYIARIARAATLEVMSEDYVRTARGKGLPERVVVMRHVLRNALMPVLTVAGPIAAHLATGSFIVETMYAVPGVGALFVRSVLARDYGLILGATLLFALAIALANLLVDILYAVVDPRVRVGR
jgi:oligopeptide transport system permease protein